MFTFHLSSKWNWEKIAKNRNRSNRGENSSPTSNYNFANFYSKANISGFQGIAKSKNGIAKCRVSQIVGGCKMADVSPGHKFQSVEMSIAHPQWKYVERKHGGRQRRTPATGEVISSCQKFCQNLTSGSTADKIDLSPIFPQQWPSCSCLQNNQKSILAIRITWK